MTRNASYTTLTDVTQPASIELVDSFYECIRAVVSERKYLARLEPPSRDAVESFTRDAVAGRIDRFFALDKARVVGSCDIIPAEREGFPHSASLGIMVHREYRRMGIGSRLMKKAIGAAWDRDPTRIELEVFGSNAAAIDLYRKFGFVEEGRKLQARFIDGVFDDNVFMALLRQHNLRTQT
ncbi:MAG: GNAT family N-acetyltransferase [Chloroflexi bacterium]|nr:GNAT family N-acetyltransferase [Chloroflexota bacterium]